MHIDKPSEILGFSQIPLEVSQKLVDLPKGLLSVKVDHLTSENSLIKQQSDLYNGQAQLLQAKAALEAAQKQAPVSAQPKSN